jgi:uncharacterized protein YjiS (DUF1127 family)
MSTTDCGTEFELAARPAIAPTGIVPKGLAQTAVMARLKSAWRVLGNRIAASAVSDLDDRMLDDIGLSRRDVVVAIDHSGALDDPSLLLARAARERARTRFSRPARR